MEKKIMTGKMVAYLGLGFVALSAQMYIERLGAFEDQAFLCGMLNGAAILLLLHGVYFIAGGIAKHAKKSDDSGESK